MIKCFKIRTLAILFSAFLAGSCDKDDFFKDDKLSIQKTDYSGTQLRTDGYFFKQSKCGDNNCFRTYFFYRNGVLLQVGLKGTDLTQIEAQLLTTQFMESIISTKYDWGVFNIEGNNIKFEHWYPSERPYSAYVHSGNILNDTTFIITEIYQMKNKKKKVISDKNETYHFKAFSPKPDSTNSFVP